jgi:hypothetical protein
MKLEAWVVGCTIGSREVKLLSLSTTPWRRIGEWRYSSTLSLTSALVGGEWSASRPGHFSCRERGSVTHWIGGWVGPRTVLDAVVKRKIPSPRRESNPRTPIVQPVAQRYTDWAITAHNNNNKCAKLLFCNIQHLSKWIKVNLSLCLIKHNAMKTYEGGRIAPCIVNLAIKWSWLEPVWTRWRREKFPTPVSVVCFVD